MEQKLQNTPELVSELVLRSQYPLDLRTWRSDVNRGDSIEAKEYYAEFVAALFSGNISYEGLGTKAEQEKRVFSELFIVAEQWKADPSDVHDMYVLYTNKIFSNYTK